MMMLNAVLPPRVTVLATKINRTLAPFNPSSHDYLCAAKPIIGKREMHNNFIVFATKINLRSPGARVRPFRQKSPLRS
jgi:hypothetical protein